MNSSLTESLITQYDGSNGALFYHLVMGDQSNHIHFGIFENEEDTVRKASENTVRFVADQVRKHVHLDATLRIIDLGSGVGGAAHYLAETYRTPVSCVNLCPEQNRINLTTAKERSLDHLIDVHEMDFARLDESWNGRFDVAWSIDALCHSIEKKPVLREAKQVLSPEGIFVFTDILVGDNYERSKLESFAKHNVGRLASHEEYLNDFDAVGLNLLASHDLSKHLSPFFTKMRKKLESERATLLSMQMDLDYIEAYASSLQERERLMKEGAFSWRCYVLR